MINNLILIVFSFIINRIENLINNQNNQNCLKIYFYNILKYCTQYYILEDSNVDNLMRGNKGESCS